MANETKLKPGAEAAHPNEGIKLDGFDYENLKGSKFHEYLTLVQGELTDPDDKTSPRQGGLDVTKKYRFGVYDVQPRYKRLFPGSKVDNTEYLDGITLVRSQPKKSVLTTLRNALLLNGQLVSKQVTGDGGSAPVYQYYLLEPAPAAPAKPARGEKGEKE